MRAAPGGRTERLIAAVTARGASPADIVYLGGVAGEYATDNRVAGFRAALAAAGHRPDDGALFRCGYPPENSCEALERHAALRGSVPAGILVNSIAAFEGLVQFAARQPPGGLDRLIVGCFDWDPFAAHLPYDVVMLRQDAEAMVGEAFAALAAERQGGGLVMIDPVWTGTAADAG